MEKKQFYNIKHKIMISWNAICVDMTWKGDISLSSSRLTNNKLRITHIDLINVIEDKLKKMLTLNVTQDKSSVDHEIYLRLIICVVYCV